MINKRKGKGREKDRNRGEKLKKGKKGKKGGKKGEKGIRVLKGEKYLKFFSLSMNICHVWGLGRGRGMTAKKSAKTGKNFNTFQRGGGGILLVGLNI